MQKRHQNRTAYFKELSITSRNYFIPYIRRWHPVEAGMNVLEIGCGDGGNLLPFAEAGCQTTGVDICKGRIDDARAFFAAARMGGVFFAEDIFKMKNLERGFDIILCHDVLEHISDKVQFLRNLSRYLKPGGIVFMSFPAWQMPFGGHQQICRSAILSHLPFVHLLPVPLYRFVIKAFGDGGAVSQLLDIKQTGLSIEKFERLLGQTTLTIEHRLLWFINPHYHTKFGLTPRRLSPLIARLPYLRNFFTTTCFYILRDRP